MTVEDNVDEVLQRHKRDNMLAHFMGCALTGLCMVEDERKYSPPASMAEMAADIGMASYVAWLVVCDEAEETNITLVPKREKNGCAIIP